MQEKKVEKYGNFGNSQIIKVTFKLSLSVYIRLFF